MGNISDVGLKALAKAGCGVGLRTLLLGACPSSCMSFELRARAVTCLPFVLCCDVEWPDGCVWPFVGCACSLQLCLAM